MYLYFMSVILYAAKIPRINKTAKLFLKYLPNNSQHIPQPFANPLYIRVWDRVYDRYMFAQHVPALKPRSTKGLQRVEVYVRVIIGKSYKKEVSVIVTSDTIHHLFLST